MMIFSLDDPSFDVSKGVKVPYDYCIIVNFSLYIGYDLVIYLGALSVISFSFIDVLIIT